MQEGDRKYNIDDDSNENFFKQDFFFFEIRNG